MLSIHNAYDQRSVSKRKLKRKDPLNKCKLPCPRPGEKQEEIYEEGTGLPFCRSALQPVNFFFQKDLFLKGFCFSNLMQCPTKLREMSSFLDISLYSFLSFLFFLFFLYHWWTICLISVFFRLPEIFSTEFSVLSGLLIMCRGKKETLLRIKSQT